MNPKLITRLQAYIEKAMADGLKVKLIKVPPTFAIGDTFMGFPVVVDEAVVGYVLEYEDDA